MDTRSKNISYHSLVKFLAFLLVALALTTAFVQVVAIPMMQIPFETLVEPSLADSQSFLRQARGGPVYDQVEWTRMRSVALERVWIFAASLVAALGLLVYLTLVIGRTEKSGPVRLNWHDRIPGDLLTAGYFGFLALWVLVLDGILDPGPGVLFNSPWVMGVVTVMVFLLMVILGFYYLSLVKQIKAGTLIKKSLGYRLAAGIYDFLKSLFDGRAFSRNGLTRALFQRQLLFIGISAVMVFMAFVFLMVPPFSLLPVFLEGVVIYWYVTGNRKTYAAIDQGFNASLEEQMKAERMKIQLITNVSHDLKTPLTAIIGYVDLLAKEALDEPAREYVTVLSEKSDRLKHIVSDLFDLARSTTGNLQVDFERIDFKRLIEQTMGDLSEEIEASGLAFKVQLPEEGIFVRADGKKLYRVWINLLQNALNYAMKGTRVYVTLDLFQGEARASIKNIAGYEMTFTEEEVLQRFARGEASRTSEGTGLGLSIAQSFTQVCGGEFQLRLDGDLFKVTLIFPAIQE